MSNTETKQAEKVADFEDDDFFADITDEHPMDDDAEETVTEETSAVVDEAPVAEEVQDFIDEDEVSDEAWEASARTDEMSVLAAELETLKAGITTEWVTVTPPMAEKWLENNPNRSVKKRSVKNLAASMTKGQWKHTGETVKFDNEGGLRDGQHRLLAIIESDQARNMLVTRGIEPESQLPMDTGSSRSFADNLAIKYPLVKDEDGTQRGFNKTVGGTVDKMIQSAWTYANGSLQTGTKNGPSNLQDKMDVFESKKDIYEQIARRVLTVEKEMNTIFKNSGGGVKFSPKRGPMGAMMMIMDEINAERAETFWDCLSSMNFDPALEGQDPVQKFHDLLQDDAKAVSRGRPSMSANEYVWHLTTCFNAFCRGEVIAKMSFNPRRKEGFVAFNGIDDVDMEALFGLPSSINA